MDNTFFDELSHVLLSNERPSVYLYEKLRTDMAEKYFPELAALGGVPQNTLYHQEGDALTHTMMVLDEAAKCRSKAFRPLGFMLSAICHDFGKSTATVVTDGIAHAFSHETAGIPLALSFMSRLTDDTQLIHYVSNMTELHMKPNVMANAMCKPKSTNHLFDSSVEPYDLILLAECDSMGKLPQSDSNMPFLTERLEHYRRIMALPYVAADDLIAVGIPQNEYFPEILEYAHKLRLAEIEKSSALKQTLAYAHELKRRKGR